MAVCHVGRLGGSPALSLSCSLCMSAIPLPSSLPFSHTPGLLSHTDLWFGEFFLLFVLFVSLLHRCSGCFEDLVKGYI